VFKVAIIGSSAAGSYEQFSDRCKYFLKNKIKDGILIYATEETPFIKKFSTQYRIDVQYFYTDWKSFGKNALKERNKMLLSDCNGIIWFDDGLKDTNMIKYMAEKIGTPVKSA